MSSSASAPVGSARAVNTMPRAMAKSSSMTVNPCRECLGTLRASAGRGRGRRLDLLLVARGMVSLVSPDGDHRFQLQETLLPNPLDVHQLLDLLEGTVFLPVFDDALSGAGTDSGKGLKLSDRCRVEIDGAARCRPRLGCACGLAAAPRFGCLR